MHLKKTNLRLFVFIQVICLLEPKGVEEGPFHSPCLFQNMLIGKFLNT